MCIEICLRFVKNWRNWHYPQPDLCDISVKNRLGGTLYYYDPCLRLFAWQPIIDCHEAACFPPPRSQLTRVSPDFDIIAAIAAFRAKMSDGLPINVRLLQCCCCALWPIRLALSKTAESGETMEHSSDVTVDVTANLSSFLREKQRSLPWRRSLGRL